MLEAKFEALNFSHKKKPEVTKKKGTALCIVNNTTLEYEYWYNVPIWMQTTQKAIKNFIISMKFNDLPMAESIEGGVIS